MSGTVTITLDEVEKEALRHETSEPYGHEVRTRLFAKLRAALDPSDVDLMAPLMDSFDAVMRRPTDQPQVPSGQQQLEKILHDLASTVGRARAALTLSLAPDEARIREAESNLTEAAEAVGELRQHVAQQVPSVPLGDEERERLATAEKLLIQITRYPQEGHPGRPAVDYVAAAIESEVGK